MKTVFTFCLLFLATVSFGQTNFRSAFKDVNFDADFGFDDVVQMDDGSYVCAGWSELYNVDNEGF